MSVSCPACQSTEIADSVQIPDHEYNLDFRATYSTCGNCQTIFQTPMPTLEELAAFYPNSYHSFSKKSALTKLRNELRLNKLKPYIKSNGTVFDYGCGGGGFLIDAAEIMPDVHFYGYEISGEKEIEKHLDGRVIIIKGSWEDIKSEIPSCDLITMNHVIEHLPDPHALITDLFRKLNPSGTLLGQTPASDSLERAVFKKQWSGYHAPRHTVIFSRKGLATFLRNIQFTNVDVKQGFNPAGLAVSFASLPHGNNPGFIRRSGFGWLLCLGLAALFYPLDLLSGKSGIIDFKGQK